MNVLKECKMSNMLMFSCLADVPSIRGQVYLEPLSLQQKIPHSELQTAP